MRWIISVRISKSPSCWKQRSLVQATIHTYIVCIPMSMEFGTRDNSYLHCMYTDVHGVWYKRQFILTLYVYLCPWSLVQETIHTYIVCIPMSMEFGTRDNSYLHCMYTDVHKSCFNSCRVVPLVWLRSTEVSRVFAFATWYSCVLILLRQIPVYHYKSIILPTIYQAK